MGVRRSSILKSFLTIIAAVGVLASYAGAADKKTCTLHFSKLPEIESIKFESRFFGHNSGVNRPLTGGEPAYDYSGHMIKDGDLYRLYSGARWRTPGKEHGDGDHVIQHVSKTGQGGTYAMLKNEPEFWKGCEEGSLDTWFHNNYMDPEVIKFRGKYYMYTQLEIDPGVPIDIPGEKAKIQADRIQLHVSTDGTNWKRWSEERGVVVNIENPTVTSLHHHETVYVPWDKDRKPFWMYLAVNVDGKFTGHWRIRSKVPWTFDWRDREKVEGMSQIGNQIAYAKQAPGGPLFVRITFTGENGRHVPALQFSRDGLKWFAGDEGAALLDGSHDNKDNKNCYFLGICTIDGTGELEYLGDNTYRALYCATTSNTPVAMEIFYSEIGVGEVTFRIEPQKASNQ